MSIVSGLPNVKIPLVIGTQAAPNASGAWNLAGKGNTIQFTSLGIGTYYISWNPRVVPANAANQITQYQFAITINQPFGVAGNTILATSPLCGLIGQAAGNAVSWPVSNVVTITNNNTPVYVYLNVVAVGGWYMNIAQDIPNLDDIDVTRIC
jgi:hypothetical protein